MELTIETRPCFSLVVPTPALTRSALSNAKCLIPELWFNFVKFNGFSWPNLTMRGSKVTMLKFLNFNSFQSQLNSTHLLKTWVKIHHLIFNWNIIIYLTQFIICKSKRVIKEKWKTLTSTNSKGLNWRNRRSFARQRWEGDV